MGLSTIPQIPQKYLRLFYRAVFTIEETALYLGRSTQHVKQLINDGKIGIILEPNQKGSKLKQSITKKSVDDYLLKETVFKGGAKRERQTV